MDNLIDFTSGYSSASQNIELVEAKGKDGVLGTIKGNFFFPEVPSRNKRVYPTEAWGNALKDKNTKRIMEGKLMYGTVGHDDVDYDRLIREGKVSHITTKLKINPNNPQEGYGEADILDTPLGRLVHTLYKAGSKLSVSSKAYGELKGKDDDGNGIVDSKSFKIERFDIVVDPGYLKAQPDLQEALNEIYNSDELNEDAIDYEKVDKITKQLLKETKNKEDKQEEGSEMSEKLAEKLMEEKVVLEGNLGEVTKQLEASDAKLKEHEDSIKEHEEVKAENVTLKEKEGVVNKFVEEHGDLEKVAGTLKEGKELSERVEKMGGISKMETAIKSAHSFLTAYKESALGPIAKVKEALESAKGFNEEISKLGGLAKIKETLRNAYAFINKIKEAQTTSSVESLVKEFGISEEKAKDFLSKMSEDSVRATLKDLKESVGIVDKYSKGSDGGDKGMVESILKGGKTSGQKLTETLNSKAKDSTSDSQRIANMFDK